MKNIYFLRHGETKLNKSWKHQFPNTPLSANGMRQAGKIARSFEKTDIDLIISSDIERAKETANIISGVIGKNVETTELFRELKRPSELLGVSWFSPKTLKIMGSLYLNASKPNWHYSDEENLEEFYKRAQKAMSFLSERKEKNILVITHRGFMANILWQIKNNGKKSIKGYKKALWKNLEIGNCCYFKTTLKNKEGEWETNGDIICD
jgi:probable phosphoglycerate mutase